MTERTSRRALRLALTSGAATLTGGLATLSLGSALAQDTDETVIDDARTAPVLTSVVTNPALRGEDASITVTDQSAIVIDADAVVAQDASVVVGGEAANVAAVRVTDEVTGSYAQAGTITLDAPTPDVVRGLAPPAFEEGRFGFLIEEGAGLTGDVTFAAGSSVLVDAEDGAAIGVLGRVGGDLDVSGVAGITGAGAAAVLIGEDAVVDGEVTIGSAAALRGTGLGTDAFRLDGQAERLVFEGAARATAYTDGAAGFFGATTAPEGDPALPDQADFAGSGSAVVITGDVAGGALFAGSTLAVRGDGPALLIGEGARLGTRDDDEDTTEVDETVAFGLANSGNVAASGVAAGVDATAIRVGEAAIEGGIRTTGGIEATASGVDADAVGILIGEGANVPRLVNDGLIRVAATTDTGDAVAIRDLSGTLTELTNTDQIGAATRDFDDEDDGTTTDDQPASGAGIAIDLSANTSGVAIANTFTTTGRVDVQGNPVDENGDPVGEDGTQARVVQDVGVVIGDVLTGSGDDRFVSDAGFGGRTGFVSGDIATGAGDDLVAFSRGSRLIGDLFLGEGADVVTLDGSGTSAAGRIDFGGDAGSLSITNGAAFEGTLSAAEGADVTLGAGSRFGLAAGADVTIGSLTTLAAEGAEGETRSAGALVEFVVAEDGSGVAALDVAGDVTLASDTELRARFGSAFIGDLDGLGSVTLIRTGGTLDADVEALSASLAEGGPFLFDQALTREARDDLVFSLRRKDAQALGIDQAVAPAYEPVIQALAAAGEDVADEDGVVLRRADQALGAAVFNLGSQDEFLEAFDQFLPGGVEAPLTYARVQNDSVSSLVSARVEGLREGFGRERTAWLQEQSFFVDRPADGTSRGFDGGGFVVAVGVDTPLGPIDTVGVTGSIGSARYDETEGNDFPTDRLTYAAGVYAAETIGRLQLDARASYGTTSTEAERVVIVGQQVDRSGERRSVTGEWDGSQVSAYGRVRYDGQLGRWDVLPFVSVDYLRIEEDGYAEEGSPLDANIALSVEDREATSLRGNLGVSVGRTYELQPSRFDTTIPGIVAPRLTAAWSQELDAEDLEATYRFAGGDAFTLTEEKEDGSAIVGADLLYENQYAKLFGGVAGQFGEDTSVYTLRVGVGLKW